MTTNRKIVFKEIITESLEDRAFTFTPREGIWKVLSKKATVITGVRRCGKTSLLSQLATEWKNEKKGREWFYINFVDDRLVSMEVEELNQILEAYEEICIQKKWVHSEVLLILDEIQEIKGWEFFIERILRKKNFFVALSGSSSKMLSTEIATQMRGRTLSLELFPMSLTEAARHLQISTDINTLSQRARWKDFCQQYLNWGGFPEVLNETVPLFKRRILQQYVDTVVLRDIVERHKLQQVLAIKQFQHLLFGNFSAQMSQNKLLEKLKAQGVKLDRNLTPTLLDAFLECYSCFLVSIHSDSVHKQQVNTKKVYLIDTGFATLMGQNLFNNQGRFLENAVFIHLRRQGFQIHYGRTEDGLEVDFVVRKNPEAPLELFQVSWSIRNEETRKRELRALYEYMKTYAIKKATIITEDDAEIIKNENDQVIMVEPFWKWALNN